MLCFLVFLCPVPLNLSNPFIVPLEIVYIYPFFRCSFLTQISDALEVSSFDESFKTAGDIFLNYSVLLNALHT
jgi:hypothetical protein